MSEDRTELAINPTSNCRRSRRAMHEVKKCNSCGNTYPSTLSFCLNDGSPLVQVDTLIGTVLDGRYRLDKIIGEGGMGDVYRATHVHIDTEFAVKLLKPDFVANQTAIKRFRLEAKAAGRIHHPNAVRVTDFGVTPERVVYLVMELVQGHSLRSQMRNEKKLDYVRAVNIVRQICGAVDAAHRGGVIHRDLKPDNILIEKVHDTERVKVLDFGIAKLKETKTDAFLTQAGTIIGTPQYMSPEQCQGKPLDPASDIYSIGILLYEMLGGAVPFDGESVLQVVYDQLHAPPRPLRELSPDTPEAIAQVVMRALCKEPAERQSTANQLNDELRQAVEMTGEGAYLPNTNPLTFIPRDSATMRRPSVEVPTAEERPGLTPSFSGGAPLSSDRETTALSRPDGRETNVMSQPDTKPGADLNFAQLETGRSSRTQLIAVAAIVLIALIGIVIYISMSPSQITTEERPP